MTQGDPREAEPAPTRIARATRKRISDEPIVNALHAWAPEIVLLLYAAGMAYMSFVPFDLTNAPSAGVDRGVFLGLPVPSFNMPDILVNIAMYAPLGAAAMLAGRRRGWRRLTAGLLAVAAVAAMAYAIEFGQRYVESRVSSGVDLTCNVLGAALGAVFVALWEQPVHSAIQRVRRSLIRDGRVLAVNGFVCAVLLVQLRPFDIVVDPIHTAYGLRHASVSPVARWNGLPADVSRSVIEGRRVGTHELARVQWEYCLDRIVDVALYAGVGALVWLSQARRFRQQRTSLFLWCGFVTVSLAVMVMLLRVFLISHGLDTAQLSCGVLGWLVGMIGVRLLPPADPTEIDGNAPEALADPRRWAPGHAAAIGCIAVCLLVVMYELIPFDFQPRRHSGVGRQMGAIWVPLYGHFLSRPNDAFYDLSGKFLRYACLAAGLAMLLRRLPRLRWRIHLAVTVVATALLATLFQAAHVFSPSRHTDVTTVLIAIVAAATSAVALRWWIDYRACLTGRFVSDLLTTQLIDGPSFDPEKARLPRSRRGDACPTVPAESRPPD